jgi:laminin alpha 3/5
MTPEMKPVRFAIDSEQFGGAFSWRGFAVFSPIQEEIIVETDVAKATVYRVLLRYRNPTSVPIETTITVTPLYTHTQGE